MKTFNQRIISNNKKKMKKRILFRMMGLLAKRLKELEKIRRRKGI